MRAFGKALRAMLKRPFIVGFLGLMTLIYCVIDYYNPLTQLLVAFQSMGHGDFFESLIYIIRLIIGSVTNVNLIMKGLIYFIAFLILTSILLGFLLSGYFNIINNTMDRKPKVRGEFIEGIRKYFLRMTTVSFRVIILSIIFGIVIMIAMVPAAIITKAWLSSKPEFIAMALFLDILTLGILFFGLMFFRVYILFWYPAVLNYGKGAFAAGKKAADKYFWAIVGRFIVFDIIFVLFQILSSYLNMSVLKDGNQGYRYAVFILVWFFRTIYFSCFVTYIFSAFKITEKATLDKAG